jgi:hypothetical protein
MLARRDLKATIIGVVLTSIFALGCFAWLACHSDFGSVVDGIRSGQEAFHDDPTEEPLNTWTRIDLAGMAAKVMQRVPGTPEYLGVMLVLLILPCVVIWKASSAEVSRHERSAGGLSALLVVLTLMVSVYHHSYDCIVLSVSLFATAIGSRHLIQDFPRPYSAGVAILLAVPMMNYVSTRAARDRLGFEQADWLWQVVTMTNGICLSIALLIVIGFVFGNRRPKSMN